MEFWDELFKLINQTRNEIFVAVIVAIIVGIITYFGKWLIKKSTDFFANLQNNKTFNSRDLGKNVVKNLKIEESIAEHFPEYKDYILIQYGSSVSNKIQIPSDYDYIVLLLGFPKDEKRAMHNKGTSPEANEKNYLQVDIVFRDYLSFLFAAAAGMPYENSVIVDGQVIKGEEGYFHWLKNITKNQLFDRDFLIRRFDDKIAIEKNEYKKCLAEHTDFDHSDYYVIRAGYYYITSILQRERIKRFNRVVLQNQVVELSKVRNLYEDIADGQIRKKYEKLVESLKRNILDKEIGPSDIEEILNYFITEENRSNE